MAGAAAGVTPAGGGVAGAAAGSQAKAAHKAVGSRTGGEARKVESGREAKKPPFRNFKVTLKDLQPPRPGACQATHTHTRTVALPDAAPQYLLGGGMRRLVGKGPPVTQPLPLFRNCSSVVGPHCLGDTRQAAVMIGDNGSVQLGKVKLVLGSAEAQYMKRMVARAVRDPCMDDSPEYQEGLRRMEQYLDPEGIQEVLMCHYSIRIQHITEFGRAPLENLDRSATSLLTKCRDAARLQPGGPNKDQQLLRAFYLGCYRMAALLLSRDLDKLVSKLPVGKRHDLICTFGQADYEHVRDEPDAFFRALAYTFTPPGEWCTHC
ncbi:hypothetical protein V8C86DRAFT_2661979 [Haematococcus lacustris]